MNKLVFTAATLLACGSAAFAQIPCSTSTGTPPVIRAQGDAEPVADVLLSCTGTVGTFVPPPLQLDVTLTFNAPVASKLIDGNTTEAVALVNATSSDLSNVFRILGTQETANSLLFRSVPISFVSNTSVRFTNLRVAASALGQGNVTVRFTVNSPTSISALSNQVVASIQPGLTFDTRTCNDSAPANNPTFSQGAPQNTGVLTGGAGSLNFNVRFREPFPFNFRQRIAPNQDPSVPGTVYNSESIFVNSTFLPIDAGTATQGTRLLAAFRNVPSGVRLFVTTRPVPGASSSTIQASLVSTDALGAGTLTPVSSSATASCPLTSSTAAFGIAEIPVVNGNANAVWEVTASSGQTIEQASFGVVVAYNTPPPASGTAQVNGVLAPIATPGQRLSTPEFEVVDQTQNAFTIGAVPPPQITTQVDGMTPGTVTVPYIFQFTGTTSSPPLRWELGPNNLPFPASIDPTTGVFSATPTASGTFSITVNLFDNFYTKTPTQRTFTWIVNTLPRPVILTDAMPNGTAATPYTLQFTGTSSAPPLRWALGPNNLPFTASIDPNTGVFTATPTASGTFSVTVNLFDNFYTTTPTQKTFVWIVNELPRPVITTDAMPNGTAGTAYSLQFQGQGSRPLGWSLGANNLPFAASIDPNTGLFAANPTVGGTFNVTINLTDRNYPNSPTQKTFQWHVDNAPLRITTTSLPDASVATPYSIQVQATGGTGIYKFACAGTLPAGLSCPESGIISGTPAREESQTITVTVTDSQGATATSQPLSIRVVRPDRTVNILTRTLPPGTVGQTYTQQMIATGGIQPYKWTATGLPRGLAINGSGVITGTPQEAGTFQVTVAVTDTFGNGDNAAISLTINGAPLTLVTDSLPPGAVGGAYNVPVTAFGGTPPYVFSVTGLPSGLSFTNGAITGKPDAAGTSNVTIVLTDAANGTVTRTLPLVVTGPPPQITTTGLPSGFVGAPYSATVSATGGTPPLTWSLTGAPSGFSIDPQSGVITGAFTTATPVTLSVTVKDKNGLSATQQFTISVTNPPPLQITTAAALPDLFAGDAMNFTVGVTGGAPPYTFQLTGGSVPAGTTFNAASGSVTGPISSNAVGPVSFAITVTDAAKQTASRTFTGQVLPGLSIPSQTLSAVAGSAFNGQINVTGGRAPYNIAIAGGAPANLSFNSATGQFSGSPNAGGTFNLAVTATDAANHTATATIPLTITFPPVQGVNVGGLPQNPTPGGQAQNLTVALGESFPVDVTGTMTLTFASNAVVPGDDPRIVFSNNRRTATFTVAHDQRNGTFTDPNLGIALGTVAGTITLTPTLQANGANVPCTCTPQTIVIPRTPPVIRTVTARRTTGGFTVDVVGFSTSRELTTATFSFTQGTGANLQTNQVTLQVGTVFDTYFKSAEGQQNGSQFTLTVPFTVSGDQNAVSSVAVVLTNAVGSSPSTSATVQ